MYNLLLIFLVVRTPNPTFQIRKTPNPTFPQGGRGKKRGIN